ncbi:MAG: gamma-glutamyltransferase [Rhizobiales bacterium]|nr:gamma-glutamyltransferase [Hyphomicrobiales bacterium]
MRNLHLPGRSPVVATNAMCATSHPLASLAAIEAMKDGGNAVDAALAAAAVLVVVEPAMTGIGGDCFAMVHAPGKGLRLVSGAGKAPAGLTAGELRDRGLAQIARGRPEAVTVPCAVDAWCRLSADFGKLALERVLAPAIALAENGFAVAQRVASDWNEVSAHLAVHPGSRKHLLAGGRAPRMGDVVRFPALAATLREIASKGRDGFYSGWVAEDLVATLRAMGGVHTLEDFAAAEALTVDPIELAWHGRDVLEFPPSNQGVMALMMLQIAERLAPMKDAGPLSARRYHLLMEGARLAYTARAAHLADPAHAKVPIGHLLSDALADELAARIDPCRRTEDLGPVPASAGSDTIYLCVVDSDGMAVSFINSVYNSFGSGITGDRSGVWLHNRGQGFTLEEGHPNELAPGKRPMHTLVPAMVTENGQPSIVFGVMGADFQPMGHVYVLTNMLQYGMDPQEALDFPRLFFQGDHLSAEDGVPEAVCAELRAMGHGVQRRIDPWGGGQIIRIDRERGVLIAGSDHRKDGCALGY